MAKLNSKNKKILFYEVKSLFGLTLDYTSSIAKQTNSFFL